MSIFKACDVRGVVGDEWTEADARRIGASLAAMLRRRGESQICLGGDFRRSTPDFKSALTDGLLAAGADVIDVGLGPTPMVYFAARQLKLNNVAIVTASHNPGRYNGVKFLVGGRPAVPELIDELRSGLETPPASASSAGTATHQDIALAYEAWLPQKGAQLSSAVCGPRSAPPRLIVDAMAGAMSGIGRRVLTARGFHVEAIRDGVDPDFSGCDPNPAKDANLQLLIQRVRTDGACMGLGFDGDGDRVIFVDETGRIIRPEQIGALLACHCYDRPALVYDLKCASVLPRAVRAAGGTAIMRPSGHGFIKTTIIDQRADLGVEVSGHHFYGGDLHGSDDGLLTALVVCRLVRESGLMLSELIEPFPWPAITPDLRIRYDGDAQMAIEAIAVGCGGQVDRMDGVRVEYDNGWALARASITEPAITLRFEGHDWSQTRNIATRFLDAVPGLKNQVLEMMND